MGKLDGKVAIVTGGAGGIGRGSCRYLAEEGASVVLADLPGAHPLRWAEQLMLETVLTPELGDTRAIASLVAYLFSDDAAYLQGQAIHVDGGMHVHVPQLGTARYRM